MNAANPGRIRNGRIRTKQKSRMDINQNQTNSTLYISKGSVLLSTLGQVSNDQPYSQLTIA